MKNRFATKLRHRRDMQDLRRAITNAHTPAMRDELIVIAQRQLSN